MNNNIIEELYPEELINTLNKIIYKKDINSGNILPEKYPLPMIFYIKTLRINIKVKMWKAVRFKHQIAYKDKLTSLVLKFISQKKS